MLETGYMRPLKAALLAEALGRYEDLSGRLGVACHVSRGRYAPRPGRRRPVLWSDCFAVRVLRRLLCDLIRKRKEGTT